MKRSIISVLLSVAFVAGCNKQPPVQNPSQPTNVTAAPVTNEVGTNSVQQDKAPLSDLFKSQLIKLVEETTKLDQMIVQGAELAQIKAELPNAKATFESTRLVWPDGFATNALSNFGDAIRAWEFLIDLTEREQGLRARTEEIWNRYKLNINYAREQDTIRSIQNAETSANPNDLKEDDNGYQELATLGKGDLVYSTYPEDLLFVHYRGKKFLPLRENIDALQKIATTRLKNAREEALKLLK